ncbi:MAG: GFA family protein [Alphaproteobacteria bacterium]
MTGFTGGCLCGAIRFRVGGEALRIANCHCDDCRKATGASFATNVFINEADLTILQGTPKSFDHQADSGATMTKQFCGNCGTQLFGRGSRSAGVLHVKVGAIDDAGFVRPAIDVFVSRKLPFIRLSDETEHFEQGRPR